MGPAKREETTLLLQKKKRHLSLESLWRGQFYSRQKEHCIGAHRGTAGQKKFKEIQETAVTKIPGAMEREMTQIVESLVSALQNLDFIL